MTGSHNGFTLLEVVVAIGIFAIALVMIAGLFSRFTFVQRRDVDEQALQEDLRFAIEAFSRETRLAFASTYALADGSGQSLVMRNQNGLCVNYRLNPDQASLERAEVATGGTDCLGAAFAAYTPLTSSRVQVESLRFDLPDNIYNQADDQLDRQGFITLMLTVTGSDQSTPPLTVQSTITSRQAIPYAAP